MLGFWPETWEGTGLQQKLPKIGKWSEKLLLYWAVLKIMDAGYCIYVHIFIHILSQLNRLILPILILTMLLGSVTW